MLELLLPVPVRRVIVLSDRATMLDVDAFVLLLVACCFTDGLLLDFISVILLDDFGKYN